METYSYHNPENNHPEMPYRSEKKIPAAILGLLVPFLALNKFYLGYNKEGIIQIILNVVTFGIASVIPFVEGVLYLFMSDKQFDDTYVYGKRPWL